MKTTLVKIDSSNNKRKILSLNEEDMKAFILLFKNMEELKDYFSSNDEECSFSLISNNNEDYSLNKLPSIILIYVPLTPLFSHSAIKFVFILSKTLLNTGLDMPLALTN